jgi:hypothetical protein
MASKPSITRPKVAEWDKYLEGLAAYREQRWHDALRARNASLEPMRDDEPSMALLKRVESLQANPPSQGWDGPVEPRQIVAKAFAMRRPSCRDVSDPGGRPTTPAAMQADRLGFGHESYFGAELGGKP